MFRWPSPSKYQKRKEFKSGAVLDGALDMTGGSTLRESPRETYVEWTIEKISHLLEKENGFLESPPFSLCDNKWSLRIYPNGFTEEKSVGYVGLYLVSPKSKTEYEVQFTIGMKKADGSILKSVYVKYRFKEQYRFGPGRFLKQSVLMNSKDILAPDGSLTVFCNARVGDIVEIATQTSRDGPQTLSEDFKDMYISSCFADVTISVNGREFLAHRNVLSARSPVFSSMFEHDMAEKSSGRVEISDCNPDCFGDFLLFLYTGKLNMVSSENATSLYKAADKYDLEVLKEECVLRMSSELSVDSFCDVFLLATMHSEFQLLKTATEFFIGNAEAVIETVKWQYFLAENLTLGNELFLKSLKNKKKIMSE